MLELTSGSFIDDGTIYLKDSDIASLSGSDDSLSLDDEDTLVAGTTSRRVERNETQDVAMQLNAPIGVGGFVEVDHLVIVDNKAINKSLQVNHAVSQDNFEKLLAIMASR